jgi:hypothetical protein
MQVIELPVVGVRLKKQVIELPVVGFTATKLVEEAQKKVHHPQEDQIH